MRSFFVWLFLGMVVVAFAGCGDGTVSPGPTGQLTASLVNVADTGLPIVRVYTATSIDAIDKDNYVTGTITITTSDGLTTLYQGPMKTRGRGNATWYSYPKKGYRIKLDSKASLLGMPADKDWVLIANYADRSLIRYYAALELGKRINSATGSPVWVPRMEYCELYWNDEYRGNYLFGEHVKVSKNRVNIYSAPIPQETSPGSGVYTTNADLTGGYLMEIDAETVDPAKDVFFRTTLMQLPYVFKTPNGIVPPNADFDTHPLQIAWITTFINLAEKAAYAASYMDPIKGYANYFDVDSVINWFLVNEIYKNQDAKFTGWDGSSVYWFKDTDTPDLTAPRVTQNKKIFMGPIWDFDYGAGNFEDSNAKNSTGWWVYNANLIKRFMGDSSFKAKIKARWNALKTTQIDTIIPFIDATAAKLQLSQQENFKRWPILTSYVWPSPEERKSYSAYVNSLKKWLTARITWMDGQINAFPNQ
jgi:hypothetical protein